MKKSFIRVISVLLVWVTVFMVHPFGYADAQSYSKPAWISFTTVLKTLNDGVRHLQVYTVPSDEEDVSTFLFEYDTGSGKHVTEESGVYFDRKKGEIYGENNAGVFNLGFDFNVKQMTAFCPVNAWQRDFGYLRLFDVIAYFAGYRYITRRIKFSYGDMDWMLQVWKGRYYVGMGGEVGLYCKPKDRKGEYYDCVSDADMPEMSLKIYRGNRIFCERTLQKHWWINSFALSGQVSPEKVTLESTVIFKDSGMNGACLAALSEIPEISYTLSGNAIHLVW